MIVCHCGVVTYEALVRSLEGGSKTLDDLREDTGCCADCCGCEKAIQKLLTNMPIPNPESES